MKTALKKTEITRKTKETEISVLLSPEPGLCEIDTGIGFFDHMLTAFAVHGGFGLRVKAKGDLQVDDHHTVEDVGIVLGQAFAQALPDKTGIERFGRALIPMDESLASAAVDFSGRGFLVFHADFRWQKCGEMETAMVGEFFRALALNAGLTLHLNLLYGENDHHKIEALFKAAARAFRAALEVTGKTMPSSKGAL